MTWGIALAVALMAVHALIEFRSFLIGIRSASVAHALVGLAFVVSDLAVAYLVLSLGATR